MGRPSYFQGCATGLGGRAGKNRARLKGRDGRAFARDRNLHADEFAERFAAAIGQPPDGGVIARRKRRVQTHGDIDLALRLDRLADFAGVALHQVAADEDDGVAGFPGAGAGVFQGPGFQEDLAGRDDCAVGNRDIGDKGRVVAVIVLDRGRAGKRGGRGRLGDGGAGGRGGGVGRAGQRGEGRGGLGGDGFGNGRLDLGGGFFGGGDADRAASAQQQGQ